MFKAQSISTAQPHRFDAVEYGYFDQDDRTDRLPTWAAGFCIVSACSIFWVGALTILTWIIR